MRQRSKSTLFLIEQLIVIAVFAICAAACISILTNAYFMARDSRDISNALFAAESVAETFKAVSADFDQAAEISGGISAREGTAESLKVFFDNYWAVSSEQDAKFILELIPNDTSIQNSRLRTTQLTVSRTCGDQLVTFPVAVRP